MLYIASILLLTMAIGLTFCGILLWKRRHQPDDYSRSILSVLCWITAGVAAYLICQIGTGTITTNEELLKPSYTFVPIFMLLGMLIYPLEVIQPTRSKVKICFLVLFPWVMVVLIGLYGGIEYTRIHQYAQLIEHIDEANVLFRLITLIALPFSGLALCVLPYNPHKTSANHQLITWYVLGILLIGLLHLVTQLMLIAWLPLLQLLMLFIYLLTMTYFELRERLCVPKTRD